MFAAISSSVVHNTFTIERTFPVSPGRVFRALADPVRKRKWFAEGNHHDVEIFEMDFRVGGTEISRNRFKQGTSFPGVLFTYAGQYHDIVPDCRIVMSATMSMAEKRISVSLITYELNPVAAGTQLLFTYQTAFFEGSDGPDMRKNGWQSILGKLETYLATSAAEEA